MRSSGQSRRQRHTHVEPAADGFSPLASGSERPLFHGLDHGLVHRRAKPGPTEQVDPERVTALRHQDAHDDNVAARTACQIAGKSRIDSARNPRRDVDLARIEELAGGGLGHYGERLLDDRSRRRGDNRGRGWCHRRRDGGRNWLSRGGSLPIALDRGFRGAHCTRRRDCRCGRAAIVGVDGGAGRGSGWAACTAGNPAPAARWPRASLRARRVRSSAARARALQPPAQRPPSSRRPDVEAKGRRSALRPRQRQELLPPPPPRRANLAAGRPPQRPREHLRGPGTTLRRQLVSVNDCGSASAARNNRRGFCGWCVGRHDGRGHRVRERFGRRRCR